MTAPHPQFARYFGVLAGAGGGLFAPWAGDVFRSALPKWMSKPYRLSGVGAVLTGGRWNVRHLMPAVYFSTAAVTVAAEADAKANRFGWTAANLNPQTRAALHLELQAVLDLTAADTLAAFGLQAGDLTGCDWEADQTADREALTQAVARAAFEHEAEGLVVPSGRLAGGVNAPRPQPSYR